MRLYIKRIGYYLTQYGKLSDRKNSYLIITSLCRTLFCTETLCAVELYYFKDTTFK